jgi:hypothetical protein
MYEMITANKNTDVEAKRVTDENWDTEFCKKGEGYNGRLIGRLIEETSTYIVIESNGWMFKLLKSDFDGLETIEATTALEAHEKVAKIDPEYARAEFIKMYCKDGIEKGVKNLLGDNPTDREKQMINNILGKGFYNE